MMRSHSCIPRTFKKHEGRRSRTSVFALIGRASVVASLIVFLISAIAYADQLSGTILGANGRPKKFVLIDILGPTKVFTRSDGNGKFAVSVSRGRYIIRIRDNRNRAEIDMFIEGNMEKVFRTNW